MEKPYKQTERFLDFMLGHVTELDTSSAKYDDDGKVKRVLISKRLIATANDRAAVLPWLRARNTEEEGMNIWVRPAASLEAHPLVMLDDLPIARARAVSRKYAGAAVETSPGFGQAWIVLTHPLDREHRQTVAAALCALIGSDPDAISEPRWGRLPGFRQRKPGKSGWTNLLTVSDGRALDPAPYLEGMPSPPHLRAAVLPPNGAGGPSCPPSGRDESKCEFKFAIFSLLHGVADEQIAAAIAARALARGKRRTPEQAERYGRKTTAAAREVLNLN